MPAEDLEARVKRLEDIEEIKQLKNRYCSALDKPDWKGVVDTFAEDSVIDLGALGTYPKAKMEQFFKDLPKSMPFMVHTWHNEVIDIQGDKATARWHYDLSATQAPSQAVWIKGTFDDELVRENGEWKFKSVIVRPFYVTPYEKSWVK